MKKSTPILPTATLFELGEIRIAPLATLRLTAGEVINALRRHASGDWGEVVGMDCCHNEKALDDFDRIVSVYRSTKKALFLVITDDHRETTTVMMHCER